MERHYRLSSHNLLSVILILVVMSYLAPGISVTKTICTVNVESVVGLKLTSSEYHTMLGQPYIFS